MIIRVNRTFAKSFGIVIATILLIHPSRFSPLNYETVPTEKLTDLLMKDVYSKSAFKSSVRNCSLDMDKLKEYKHDMSLFNRDVPIVESDDDFARRFDIKPGGLWSPPDCRPQYKTLLIVPYRRRNTQDDNLDRFLRLMHPFLQNQRLNYAIIVVEQSERDLFNRAKLLNVGYAEAASAGLLGLGACLVFHDLDLIPLDGRNVYACFAAGRPRHLSSNVDTFRYSLIYEESFGGVASMGVPVFAEVNGFSNEFYGWGGEDDDMATNRLNPSGYTFLRTEPELGRYRSLPHKQEVRTGANDRMLRQKRKRMRMDKKSFLRDGLNSLNYTRKSAERRPLYYHVLVDV